MTYLNKTTLALALAVGAFGATGLFAGNGDMDQLRDQLREQLKDGSCQELLDETLAANPDATMEQIRLRLRDGSCLLDQTDDEVLAQQVRTRTGEDNGNGEVLRHRNEGGAKAQSGGGKN